MSLGTPSRERKKTTSIPAPSSKKNASSSNKNGVKPTNSKMGKAEEKLKKPSKSVKKENPPEKKSSKGTEKSKGADKKKVEKPSPPVFKPPTPESVIDNQIYEDDFENYSDDFESDGVDSADDSSEKIIPQKIRSPSPKEEIVEELKEEKREESSRAPPKPPSPELSENEVEDLPIQREEDTPMLRRLATAHGRREPAVIPAAPVPQKREPRVLSASERKIDFSTSRNYDIDAMSNNERRYQKLRQFITFDSVKTLILDKPPVKDYDFYMQLFGDRGKMQTSTQTRDDDVPQSVQTEQPTQRGIWTQAPAISGGDWGEDEIARREEDDGMSIFRENHLENTKLKQFMETASQIILDLMAARKRGGKLLDLGERSDLAFSAGIHSIKLQPLAQKYKCTALAKSDRSSQIITAAFMIEDSPASDIEGRSLIVETIVDCSRPPERLFVTNGEVSCMIYSPDDAGLYVGLKDGSITAFDLLESDIFFENHLPWIDSSVDIALRRPSFDTSFLSAAISADGAAPIVAIHATNTHLSALDSSATLYLYGIQRDDSPRPGKAAGVRLTLALTAMIKPDSAVLKSASQPTPLIATCMAVTDDRQYVIGTDAGFLCSMSRSKNATTHVGPRLYRGKMQSFGEVTALRLSPFDNKMLVAGLSTGSIQLIRLDQAVPILVLTPPASIRLPVTSIEWSPTSNTGFYSWHGGDKILFWDISISRIPITTSELPSQILPGVTICWLESSDQRIGFLAQAANDGSVEVHALEPPRSNNMRLGSAVRTLEAA